jgi:hypothetical protein
MFLLSRAIAQLSLFSLSHFVDVSIRGCNECEAPALGGCDVVACAVCDNMLLSEAG